MLFYYAIQSIAIQNMLLYITIWNFIIEFDIQTGRFSGNRKKHFKSHCAADMAHIPSPKIGTRFPIKPVR